MPRSAARTTHGRPAARGILSVASASAARRRGKSNITELFDLGGRFDRNEITREEIDKLRNLVDTDGVRSVSEKVGVTAPVIYAVCAGFGHRLLRKTAAKVRDFLR